MGYLVAQQVSTGLDAQGGDLFEVAGSDIGLGKDPAAAHGVDEGGRDILAHILGIDAACRNELDPAKGAGQSLHGTQDTVDIGREEFNHVQSQFHSGHDLAGGDATWGDGHAVVDTPLYDLRIKAGRDDEFGPHLHRLLTLLQRDDRTGAHQHVWTVVRHRLDGIGRSCRTERDLHYVNPTRQECLRSGHRILSVVNHNYRDDSSVA